MSKTPLEKAITLLGSQAALGESVGKSQGHVSKWVERNSRVPSDMAIPIEQATNGAVTRHDLRPDVFGEAQ